MGECQFEGGADSMWIWGLGAKDELGNLEEAHRVQPLGSGHTGPFSLQTLRAASEDINLISPAAAAAAAKVEL